MDRRSRSRSRSRSPSPRGGRREYHRDEFRGRDDFRGGRERRDTRPREKDRDQLERERRERMARLRAENEAEEKGDVGASAEGGEKDDAAKRHASLPDHSKAKKSAGGEDDEEADEEQQQMMQMMGFGGFGTTKGKAVADNQSSAARGAASKNKGRKYRQYMNRKGGFNRPLDKMN